MTSMIDKYFPVLDKGFIALKSIMGGDEDVEQAARVSYGKGTRKRSETKGLLRYLMRHRHSTPFEMVEYKFHIKIPMDAWRQMIRHRTASVNEYSTRYSEAIDDRQCTDPNEWRLQSKSNKQGSSGFVEDWPEGHDYRIASNGNAYRGDHKVSVTTFSPGELLTREELKLHEHAQRVYNDRLEFGVAREQARKDLPLSTYTEAFWKMDLKNLLHFLSLRCDSHAQLEIRQYANVIAGIVKETCPLVFEAWYDYAFQAVNFSRLDRELLNWMHENTYYDSMDGFGVSERGEELGMSKRELNEFWQKISTPNPVDFNLDMSKAVEYEELQKND